MPVGGTLSLAGRHCLLLAYIKRLLCVNFTLVLVWEHLTTSNSFWGPLHTVWIIREERLASILGKNQYDPRRLPADDELLLMLVELWHNFPESDLAACSAVSQSTVSRTFST